MIEDVTPQNWKENWLYLCHVCGKTFRVKV
jgi:hypothetical protein